MRTQNTAGGYRMFGNSKTNVSGWGSKKCSWLIMMLIMGWQRSDFYGSQIISELMVKVIKQANQPTNNEA